jgi:hypothetical protein
VRADASKESQAGRRQRQQQQQQQTGVAWRFSFWVLLLAELSSGRLAVTSRVYSIVIIIFVRWTSARTESTPTDSSNYYYYY